MEFQPLKHQDIGIKWLKERNVSALFAGMGLGKSAMTLSALDDLFCDGATKGALIVAPLRVSVLTWPYEIQKWNKFKWMKVALLRTKEGMQAWKDGSADIYLLNYERIPQFCKSCLEGVNKEDMPVDTIIWDELSKAKSHSSKRINTIRKYRDLFDRHWGLTGTPRPNGIIDLFSQIRLLDGGDLLGKSFYGFRQAYLKPDNAFSQFPKWLARPGADEVVTEKLSDLSLVLRSEDWLDIPPTSVEDIEVSLPKEAAKVYKELQKEFLAELEDGKEVVAVNAAVKMNKLLQVTSGAVYDENRSVGLVHDNKIKALKKFQKDNPGPILVATAFKHEQSRILKSCKGAELFREDTLDRWVAGKIPMLVADPRSIGHGVDRLQDGGRIAVWFSPTWSRELYDQFNARLARTGQKEETRVIRIVCPGTVDDAVLESLRARGEGQDGFLAAVKNLQDLARAG
tara:strand:+ start:1601 stop:2968 length:1368 start_codon:yes stop_codon:yes gene_type:complete